MKALSIIYLILRYVSYNTQYQTVVNLVVY